MRDVSFDEFLGRIRTESDIVSIISEYVPLTKKGNNYWGCCPFHNEKTPSFSVTPNKGFFYCFGCQTGGNVLTFLMKIENLAFIDAAKLLARKINISWPEKEKSAEQVAKERELNKLYQVNELAKDFFFTCLTKTQYGRPAREYLASRGINEEMIRRFKLGFAPPAWDKLTAALSTKRIEADVILKAGLAVRKNNNELFDRFRSRIMFPICDSYGKVVGFGGRVIDNSQQPKYLNSPETVLFNKRHILYGIDIALQGIRDSGQVIITEGYLDTITAHSAGFNNVVASLGTAFTQNQAKQLLRYTKEIIFAYDSDAAGQNATLRALETINSLGATVKVLSIPDGKDPDEFIRKHGKEAFREVVENASTLLEYQVKSVFSAVDFSGLEGKVTVVSKLVPLLANAENAVEVNAQIAAISQTLNIDESAIRSEIRKHILQSNKKDNFVKKGEDNVRRMIFGSAGSALSLAEEHLIKLMCEDFTLIPYIESQLFVDEIANEQRKEIINMLFNKHSNGENKTDGLIDLSEAAANEFSRIMILDIQYDDVVKFVDDCIKNIKLAYLKNLYEYHRLRADELQRLGDSNFLQELAESQRIKHEINKIHHC